MKRQNHHLQQLMLVSTEVIGKSYIFYTDKVDEKNIFLNTSLLPNLFSAIIPPLPDLHNGYPPPHIWSDIWAEESYQVRVSPSELIFVKSYHPVDWRLSCGIPT